MLGFMSFVGPMCRMLMSLSSLGALLAVTACGGGGEEGTPQGEAPAAADFSKQGDIEFWTGKDTSGNLPKLIAKFNESHPNGKVTLHELPDEADQQRQQMIQNTQTKNPKMAESNVHAVGTAASAGS